ncbi:unnamed protein product, partial [marine sediment metagenome]
MDARHDDMGGIAAAGDGHYAPFVHGRLTPRANS